MNCDDAFDALTDPAGGRAAELAEHLASCSRCRALQKVLEPALELFSGELPREICPERQATTDVSAARQTQRSFLTVEAVALAEQTATRLAASEPTRPLRLRVRRAAGIALRSAALVLFGALAVYCVRPGDRQSRSEPIPALTPQPLQAARCTRFSLQRDGKPSRDASVVIASCVACHVKERPQPNLPLRTSLLWPIRPVEKVVAESETRRA